MLIAITKNSIISWTLITLLALFANACDSIIETHGAQIDPLSLSKIEPGKTRLAEVEALFGRPSAEGAFDSGKIYYINQIMETKPGGRKETITRTLVAFSYNNQNIITAIDISDQSTGRLIYHSDEITPTPGDTFGVFEQIFRNLRRGGAVPQ